MDYLLVFIATIVIGTALIARVVTRLTKLAPNEAPIIPMLAFVGQMGFLVYLMLHALP